MAAGCRPGDGEEAGDGAAETTDGGEDWSPEGLTITEVSFNQGVQTIVWKDGNWVDGMDIARNSVIIPGRQALVWADYELDGVWIPPKVRACLEPWDGESQGDTYCDEFESPVRPWRFEWVVDPAVIGTQSEFRHARCSFAPR